MSGGEGQQVLTYNETVCRRGQWTGGQGAPVGGRQFRGLAHALRERVFLFFFGERLPHWAGVDNCEISLGLCGFRPLCVCCTTFCLMNCLTHGTNHEHGRHEQG